MAVELMEATVTTTSNAALSGGTLADFMEPREESITTLHVRNIVIPPRESITLGNINHILAKPKHLQAFNDGKLGISCTLSISYNDAIGERQTQTLSSFGLVGRNGPADLSPSTHFVFGKLSFDTDPKNGDERKDDENR